MCEDFSHCLSSLLIAVVDRWFCASTRSLLLILSFLVDSNMVGFELFGSRNALAS